MRSNIWPMLGVTLILGALGFLGWLTRHPDAEILRRAEGWPVVGVYAERFRELYRPPPEPERRWENRGGVWVEVVEVIGRDGGAVDDFEPPPLARFVWVEAGTAIRGEPSPSAPVLAYTRALANMTQLEQRGDWYRVWSNRRQLEGWVYLPDYLDREPPLGSTPDPPGPLWPREADPDDLKQALGLLGEPRTRRALGEYTLHTDVDDPTLIASLGRAVVDMDRIYAARYGREPLGTPAESVVLYAREGAYRILQQRSSHLHGLTATGHTGPGLIYFFVGQRKRHEIRSTFVHELGHVLNRRAVGPALPPWLDEGLADDLANGAWRDGRLDPSELGGLRLDWGGHQTFEGGWSALLSLESAVEDGRMPELEQLLAYDWQRFVGSDSRLHYDAASFFVRFLLADGVEGGAEAFRAFLDDVAGGAILEPELLRTRLDRPWPELDAALRAWIVTEARKLRANPP